MIKFVDKETLLKEKQQQLEVSHEIGLYVKQYFLLVL